MSLTLSKEAMVLWLKVNAARLRLLVALDSIVIVNCAEEDDCRWRVSRS